MPEDHESLLGIVNKSGFLFQLRVRHEIETTRNKHEWQVRDEEYRWKDLETDNEGFIDLVIESRNQRMVIECKRIDIDNANWIFLVTQNIIESNISRVLWTTPFGKKYGWDELTVTPRSLRSMFCVVRGQAGSSPPMLERIAGTLLRATESLAIEDLSLDTDEDNPNKFWLYYPVIVTNATLHVCNLDTNDIDLRRGTLDLDKVSFKPVPIIRFQKELSTTMKTRDRIRRWGIESGENERTVFVINASHFSGLLTNWYFRAASSRQPFPWFHTA